MNMQFIITLITLIIERFFHWNHLRHWRWFGKYQYWLSLRIANWPSYLLLIICVLPLIIIVGLINNVLTGWLYGIPQIIFGVFVLLYCMGPDNLWVQTYSCINALSKEDPKTAIDRAHSAFGINVPNNSQAFHQALTKAIFIEASNRVFAVIFWFVLCGPIGAVLYRSISICAEHSNLGLTEIAEKIKSMLDWLPVRLFTLIFALVGHFTDVFSLWKKDVNKGLSANDKLLSECGIAALDIRNDNHLPEDGAAQKASLELLDRVLVLGVVFLAMIVIMLK